MTVAARTPLVEMRDINVAFGGVHAVRDVIIDSVAGEVIGLVGGNGAGQVDPHAGRSRAPIRPTAARSSSTASRGHPQPARRQGTTTSRPSTRRWPWPTTSTRRATCSSAAS